MQLIPLPAALAAALGLALAAAPQAQARSPVQIEGADEDAREAILDLLPDRDAPTTLFDAERIAEEAAARAMAWLRSEGYYAAEVTPEASEGPPAAARLVIAPGPRFRFAEPMVFYGDARPDEDTAQAALSAARRVAAGAPARAADVLGAEADALAALQSAGYADAAATPRRVIVDHAGGTVTAQFHFNAGERIRLGEVRVEPEGVLRPGFLRRLRNWEPGESYSPDKVAGLRRDLASTGSVSRAATRLVPAAEPGVRDVVLEVTPAKRNSYEFGAGYSTTEGAGVEAEWTRRNFSGRADSLIVATTLSEKLQDASVELRRPHAAGLGHTRRYGASVEHEETEAFSRDGLALFASVDAAPRLRLGTSYGLELTADSFDDAAGGVGEAYVLSGFGELRHDTTAHPLDARDGSVAQLRLEPSVSAGDASIGFVRATAEGRVYESFGDEDRLTMAARVRTGWVEAVSGDVNDIPPDRRFYAGGGGSVRGYEYNSIYPRERDLLGLTPGGQGMLETSLEARYRFGERIGAVAFVDGGNAFDSWGDSTDFTWGAGLGARYNLGFAPLRVDVAFPLDDIEGGEDYALYISLGQAF